MEWLGRAEIAFTHAAEPLQLPLKAGPSAGRDGELDSSSSSSSPPAPATVDLAQFCRDSTPACQLNPLLFNGHLQTMWTAVATAAPAVHYRRRLFEADPATSPFAGSFAVDFAVPPHEDHDEGLPPRTSYFSEAAFAALPSADARPMLLVLHGLSGGSYEVYLRHCLAPLLADADADWAVAVVNSRGCAGSAITSGVLFNARATWDLRQVAAWARATFPNRPLFGLGFSLGANILTNYVGEEGPGCPLAAAVAVGNPFDLQVSNKMLQRTFLGRHVYETVMGANMKALVRRHRAELAKFTDLDLDRVLAVRSLYEFDREVQCPTWGYPTEEAYYRDASSSDAVLNICIPFLAIQAKDDPIAVVDAVPFGEFRYNPYTVLCMTSLGGHLSWFEPGGGRWHARPVAQFLRKMAAEVDLAALPRDRLPAPSAHALGAGSFHPLRRRMEIGRRI